jgi:hypothetical protein
MICHSLQKYNSLTAPQIALLCVPDRIWRKELYRPPPPPHARLYGLIPLSRDSSLNSIPSRGGAAGS